MRDTTPAPMSADEIAALKREACGHPAWCAIGDTLPRIFATLSAREAEIERLRGIADGMMTSGNLSRDQITAAKYQLAKRNEAEAEIERLRTRIDELGEAVLNMEARASRAKRERDEAVKLLGPLARTAHDFAEHVRDGTYLTAAPIGLTVGDCRAARNFIDGLEKTP